MENLISLVNKIQRACTALGDHGEASALPTLWDSLPAIAVVGGQVNTRSFLLFSSSVNFFSLSFYFQLILDLNFNRVQGSLRCWKALSERIFYRVDPVKII